MKKIGIANCIAWAISFFVALYHANYPYAVASLAVLINVIGNPIYYKK